MVRVSRRVGGAADLLATEMWPAQDACARYTRPLCYPPRPEPGTGGLATRTKLHPGPRSGRSGSSREWPKKCSHRRGRTAARGPCGSRGLRLPRRQPEPWATTSRTPPFATTQFHVLLNSLFKVLFNFPSRYLFAIGLGVLFSLMWSLPHTLSCTPKQLDSREKVSTARRPPYGPITLYGPWPQSRWTWTGRHTVRRLSRTLHAARLQKSAVQCWALPGSFAITRGITVVFFSSAY